MEVKKNPEVDGDKVKTSIILIGLSYVAAISLAAFTFKSEDDNNKKSDHEGRDSKVELERTEIEKPPEEEPPPPPEIQITPEIPEEVDVKENIEEPPPPDVNPPAPPPDIKQAVETVIEDVVEFPDVEAGFPGGAAAMVKWINENVVYPQTSIEMNEQGRVFLSFVVEKNGSISNVKVERGISIDLDKEAKRVVRKMPKWSPGEAKGRSVRARCRLPINFQLN